MANKQNEDIVWDTPNTDSGGDIAWDNQSKPISSSTPPQEAFQNYIAQNAMLGAGLGAGAGVSWLAKPALDLYGANREAQTMAKQL